MLTVKRDAEIIKTPGTITPAVWNNKIKPPTYAGQTFFVETYKLQFEVVVKPITGVIVIDCEQAVALVLVLRGLVLNLHALPAPDKGY